MRAPLQRDLRDRWHTAFFELIVARTLQLLGADLQYEPAQSGHRRPVFLAKFPDASIVVEATSPVINTEMGQQAAMRQWMLDFLMTHAPVGWHTNILSLPETPPTAPRARKALFREAAARLLATDLPADQPEIRLSAKVPDGDIEILLLRRVKNPAGRGLGFQPVLSGWDNTSDRVARAVQRKRSQVRASSHPALLAIQGSAIGSDLEDFDIALFGRTIDYRGFTRETLGTGFDRSGAFFSGGDTDSRKLPIIAAVLAFLEVGFRPFPLPSLYLHPRFTGPLPLNLLQLPTRSFDSDRGIVATPPSDLNLLSGFDFVTV